MKTRFILYASGGLLCGLSAARAGTRSGGSGTTAVTIPADTVNAGGGKSAAGTGTTAVAVTASIGGIGGTVTAASPAVSNRQGFIPQILSATVAPPTGYALWASTNIPAGRDATFTGDWNGDGVTNGVAYVFGNTAPLPTGRGKIPVPPGTPSDVSIHLDYSAFLTGWQPIVRWVNGGAPEILAGGVVIAGGEVRETNPATKGYFRYRVVKP